MAELPEQGGDQQGRGAAGMEERPERAEDMGVAPAERAAPLGRQRLGQASAIQSALAPASAAAAMNGARGAEARTAARRSPARG